MTTIEDPRKAAKVRPTGSGFRPVLIGLVVAIWTDALVALFAPNRILMATWFVLTTLAIPIGLMIAGWACHTLWSGSSHLPVAKVLSYYLCIFVLVCVGFPIPLATISLLPIGQRTSVWRGHVVRAARSPLEGIGIPASLLVVRSPELGPFIQLRVSPEEYRFVAGTEDLSQLPPVEVFVVRGFTGVPLACKWKGFVAQ